MKKKIFWWFLVILWCGVIFYFTKSPSFTGANTEKLIDRSVPISYNGILTYANIIIRKLAHLFAFGILASLLWKAVHPARWSYAMAWGLATLYAMTDEWHQSFIPARSGSFQDVLLDSAGAFIFLGSIFLWHKRR